MSEQASARVLAVTGASSGIGRATAVGAAARGDHVVLAARGRRSLDAAAAECEAAGAASTLVVPTDVARDDSVAALVATARQRHGRLDAFVNSAGVVSYGRTEEVPVDVFEQVLRTNLFGSVNVARHVMPALRAQGRGSLLLVGSVLGHVTVPTMTPYVLSKWGVRALARQLEVENRDLPGVRIVYVAPGGVGTPIYQQAATYTGFEGRPPPPVADPDRVARQLLDRLDHDRRSQLSLANEVIRFGHTVLPRTYDVLVAPLLALAAQDLTRPVEPSSGNVLHPQEQHHAVRGDQASVLQSLASNLKSHASSILGR